LVADISSQLSSLTEGAAGGTDPGFTEIKPYAGPFPPSGTHEYEFTLYALQTDRLGIKPGATLQGVPAGRGARLSRHSHADRKVHQDHVAVISQNSHCKIKNSTSRPSVGEDLDIAGSGLGYDILRNGRPGVGTIPIAQRR
jgi:hypothetical protein